MEQSKAPTTNDTPLINNAPPHTQQPQAKQPWHRPTLLFVSLKVTEAAKGSISDGSAGRGSPV